MDETPDTPARIPPLSLLLGYGPVALLPLLAVGAWLSVPFAAAAAQLWGAAILLFLAGVARGLSFFTAGGPRPGQLVASLARFVLGLAGLVLPAPFAIAALLVGYIGVALYDPAAASSGAAPRFFATLRPPQMSVAVIGLAALLVLAWAP